MDQLNVTVTPAGQDYARVVPRAAQFDESARQRAGWLPRPGAGPSEPGAE